MGGRRKRPFAFIEHGAIMVAGVLNTPKAIDVSVYVVRAFVRLREYLATHKELAHKLVELDDILLFGGRTIGVAEAKHCSLLTK